MTETFLKGYAGGAPSPGAALETRCGSWGYLKTFFSAT